MTNNKKDNSKNSQQDLALLVRSLGTRVTLYQQQIAEILDVYTHDFTSINVLSETGAITAGELSKRVGLATGSVTALIDRLEKAGFVRREKHPEDRRSIIVVPESEEKKEVKEAYSQLNSKMLELSNKYTDKEQELIKSFLNDTVEILDSEIQ
ncbi:MarR family transcriptional regulator [Staphylococcus succinus]|uniref:MarR family transcriptional regulator n=1 Tax=Staphylococcus succinus TaxID=61015 RepID=A0ABX5IJG6_9STAP|nr:MarR family transcriptional regulator [Staphylococcus succinus]MEB8210538.1 MarR family transcriptional regulator [Staphylococcus succinus]PTI39724.1 MarR family transcriptional regulator [Staphylococcus succinus]PTI45830.1 MarR family transcriptional regulator [Staphylococcus succinus]PTI66729.1 MarR family transcriptional regulator [Staphylococcus succinus]RIN23214.1 MarR family transcriptional regulator [Staphylococcus succinus]